MFILENVVRALRWRVSLHWDWGAGGRITEKPLGKKHRENTGKTQGVGGGHWGEETGGLGPAGGGGDDPSTSSCQRLRGPAVERKWRLHSDGWSLRERGATRSGDQ